MFRDLGLPFLVLLGKLFGIGLSGGVAAFLPLWIAAWHKERNTP